MNKEKQNLKQFIKRILTESLIKQEKVSTKCSTNQKYQTMVWLHYGKTNYMD